MIAMKNIFINPNIMVGLNKPNKIDVGKHNHIPDEEFDSEQLQMGINVEFEHTDDPEIAKAIAKDHLAECSSYYIRLKQMEDECEEDEFDIDDKTEAIKSIEEKIEELKEKLEDLKTGDEDIEDIEDAKD